MTQGNDILRKHAEEAFAEELAVLSYYANAIAHWRHDSGDATNSLHVKKTAGFNDVA